MHDRAERIAALRYSDIADDDGPSLDDVRPGREPVRCRHPQCRYHGEPHSHFGGPVLRCGSCGRWPAHCRDECGSASVAVFLFAVVVGALLLLAVGVGQRAMCAAHDGELRYCPGYGAEGPR